MSAAKRFRESHNDSESDSPATPSLSQPKLPRTAEPHTAPLVCTLPPTCSRRPTPLASTLDLERHYATHHAHVCEVKNCGAVFPDELFLALHFTENHDTLATMRQERGEKIFRCFDKTCTKLFSSPKKRRLHLIQVHGFPKEYYFSVTNKGIGHLLKKWGDGVSMVRPAWKERPATVNDEEDGDVSPVEEDDEEEEIILHPSSRAPKPQKQTPTNGLEELEESMSTLSLVPPSIRFGRGAKRGARGSRGIPHARGGHTSSSSQELMEVDATTATVPSSQRGGRGGPPPFRGFRARGRGGPRGFPGRGRGLVLG